MAKKKKPAPKKRAASTARRKPIKSRASTAPRRASGTPAPRKIRLKPIRTLVDRALVDLQRLPPSDATDITIRHLQACSAALGDICDPNTPGGCGDTMEFDFAQALTTSRG